MMTKSKMIVEQRTFIDNAVVGANNENRTVYARNNGTRYITTMGRNIEVKDDNGILFYEWHYTTVAL